MDSALAGYPGTPLPGSGAYPGAIGVNTRGTIGSVRGCGLETPDLSNFARDEMADAFAAVEEYGLPVDQVSVGEVLQNANSRKGRNRVIYTRFCLRDLPAVCDAGPV